MSTPADDPKNELHKLLKEYESNRGMAAMVCGHPVSLMPGEEQDRLFNGFFNKQNLLVFAQSREMLLDTKQLDLDSEELAKVEDAAETLAFLFDVFNRFMQSEFDRDILREKVQPALERPIPETQPALVEALSRNIETLLFLSSQNLSEKDSWDRMVDCVQLHDALSRTLKIAHAIEKQGEGVQKTVDSCDNLRAKLELFFRGQMPGDDLQPELKELFSVLSELWGE